MWEVEHHFLEEYSHSSAPEVFLAAASQRTKNIRLGHGIVQTAPAYNHPARTAERVAMLDLVSGGRVEFGSGESSSEAELGGFGIDPVDKREQWLEGLEVAIRCMTEAPFTGVDGKFVQMPPRNVVPKPVQKPHPPLWVACSRRDTILLAAEKGIGALDLRLHRPRGGARTGSTTTRRRWPSECVPVGKAVNPNVACVTPMMCHPDEDEALDRGLEGGNFFGYSLAHYYVFGDHAPGTTDVWQEFLERRAEQGYSPEVAVAARAGARSAPRSPPARRERPAGRDRHARPAARVPAPLRGGRRRPGHLRDAGRQATATSTSGVARAVRPRGAARVHGARRRPSHGQGRAAGAGHRGGHGPQGRRRPAAARRLLLRRPPQADGRARRATSRSSSSSTASPTPTATGEAESAFHSLG